MIIVETSKVVKFAKAKRFREYLLGMAYIPLQDLPNYERAYKEVNNKTIAL